MVRIICLTAIIAVGSQPAAIATTKLKQQAETIVNAYYHGDSQQLLQLLSPLVSKTSEQRLQQLDAELTRQHVPSTGRLLVDARLNFVRQGLGKLLPEPRFRERVLTVKELHNQIQELLKEYETNDIVAGTAEAPQNLDEFEETFWALHVLSNQLLSAERATAYAFQLSAKFSPKALDNLPPQDRETVQHEHAVQQQAEVDKAQRDLAELVAELRLQRLDYGLKALAKPNLSAEKMKAAYSTTLDTEYLTEFLQQHADASQPFQRKSLQAPDLAEQVAAKGKQAAELAGDLAETSKLLFEGLHWWLRGRYGAGPELAGLAKSAAALKEKGGLIWLYMPKERIKPTNSSANPGERVPTYDRRHHYTWAWEDRRVQHSFTSHRETGRVVSRQTYKLSTFW